MSRAVVGDDVFNEDPTINKLENEVAALVGMEGALFVPTGTMANLIAELVWCSERGSEMILGDRAHMFLWEQGNGAALGGISYRALPNTRDGTIPLDLIKCAVRGDNIHSPVTRLIALENTHNQCGGRVLSPEYTEAVAKIASEAGAKLHVDGARLWNAAAALGVEPSRLASPADSVSVCFSKGLGAPAGSAVCGSREFVAKARRARKALGGGMRQVGILGAAAMEGVRTILPRIADDHANAKRLAEGIAALPGASDLLRVDPATVQTNIVMAEVGEDFRDRGIAAADLVRAFQQKGLLAVAMSTYLVRFVTHHDISESDIKRAISVVKDCLKELMLEGSKQGAGAADTAATPTAVASVDAPAAVGVSESSQTTVASDGVANASAAEGERVLAVADTEDKPDSALYQSSTAAMGEGYEQVELVGMTVSDEGFVTVFRSSTRNRAVKVVITPADPMSEGLDRNEPSTPEAITLLQLLQGIDMGSYLPSDGLGSLMGRRVGELQSLVLHEIRPSRGGFNATMIAVEQISSSRALEHDEEELLFSPMDDGHPVLDFSSDEDEDDEAVPGTMECSISSSFEAIALALRYNSLIFVKSSLLNRLRGEDEECSFDAKDIPALFPGLLEVSDARNRRNSPEVEGQDTKGKPEQIRYIEDDDEARRKGEIVDV